MKYIIAFLLAIIFWQAYDRNSLVSDLNKLKKENAEKLAEAYAAKINVEKQWAEKLTVAEQKANEKISKLEADYSAALSSSRSLSNQLKTAKQRLSGASESTKNEYVYTLSDVFEECATEIVRVAKEADGHVIDRQKLIESWPQ